jgi:metal-responsive CopG/Arc/MetJ family transcriptional regulator
MGDNRRVTSVSLPPQVLRDAEKVAKETNRSRSQLIQDAVLRYLDQHQWVKMQEEAVPYAVAKGVRTEEDVERLLRELRGRKRPGRP